MQIREQIRWNASRCNLCGQGIDRIISLCLEKEVEGFDISVHLLPLHLYQSLQVGHVQLGSVSQRPLAVPSLRAVRQWSGDNSRQCLQLLCELSIWAVWSGLIQQAAGRLIGPERGRCGFDLWLQRLQGRGRWPAFRPITWLQLSGRDVSK